MTAEELLALLALVARQQLAIVTLERQNAQLREALEEKDVAVEPDRTQRDD